MLIVKRQRLAVILSADGLHSAADLNSRALTSARFSDRGVSDVRELRRRAPEELRRAAGAGKRGSLPAPRTAGLPYRRKLQRAGDEGRARLVRLEKGET